MVKVEDIERIIDNLVSNWSIKCHPTISEIHSTLNKMDELEKLEIILDAENDYKNPLLNPLELEDYSNLTEELRKMKLKGEKGSVKELQDEIFKYEKRIIQGYDFDKYIDNIPKNFNKDDFKEDEQFKNANSKLGSIEKDVIKLQKETLNLKDIYDTDGMHYNMDGDGKYVMSMDNYFNGDCKYLNYNISHKKYLSKLDASQRSEIDNIDYLMEKSSGLPNDTILYRGTNMDIHTRIGEHKSFKGYQSTSFQKSTAETYAEDSDVPVTMVIHAPKGTKGIVGNDDAFTNGTWEHEYVLPRNTGYTVIDIDYDSNPVIMEVVLDG